MKSRQHTIRAEVEVKFQLPSAPRDEYEVAYPEIEITYTFSPGSPAVMYQRNGDPGWPAEPPEIEMMSAKLLNGDGLSPTQQQIEQWADEWINDKGFDRACDNASQRDEREYERE